MIPQVKNTATTAAVILIGVPCAVCLHLWLSGELRGWAELPDALNHASFTALMSAIFWIFFKSPLSGKITEILQTSTSPTGEKKETAVTITEPVEVKK